MAQTVSHTVLHAQWIDRDFSNWHIEGRDDIQLCYEDRMEPYPYYFARIEDGRMISGFVNVFKTKWQAITAFENGEELFPSK